MRIWHVSSARSPHSLDAVNSVVWSLASAQAAAGNDVLVVVSDRPDHDSAAAARRLGVTILHIPCTKYRFDPRMLTDALHDDKPDIVHLHSTFVPRLATLARTLAQKQIPYVLTPHGGLGTQTTGWRKHLKTIYSALVERPRFRRASAITLVTPTEEQQIRHFLPGYREAMKWIPNPVSVDPTGQHGWLAATGSRKLVFLGRFDVENGGVEQLFQIARHLPAVEVHLYGETDSRRNDDVLFELKRKMPANVFFHDPVYGAAKAEVLAGATMYLQMSRGEGFPVSVTEAMSLGTPCAISENVDIAPMFKKQDLGLLLPSTPKDAATKIAWAMDHAERLHDWSSHGLAYAQAHLHPDKAAADYLRVYKSAMPMRRPSKLLEPLSYVATRVGELAALGLGL